MRNLISGRQTNINRLEINQYIHNAAILDPVKEFLVE